MMKFKTMASIAGFGLLGTVAMMAPASAITVDGSLADWGVSVVDTPTSCGLSGASFCHYSNFASPSPSGANLLGFQNVDQNDISNSYSFVYPLGGGQNFDQEFMAVARSGNTLYVAISTGQRPDNGAPDYEPGDLKIKQTGGTNSGAVYGIELGSTTGAAITNADIGVTGGTTWKLNSNANANGASLTGGDAGTGSGSKTIGDIYGGTGANAAQFRNGALGHAGVQLDTNTAVNHDIQNLNSPGTITGTNNLVTTLTALYETGNTYTTCTPAQVIADPNGCNQHQIIEMSFDITQLLGTTDENDIAATTLTFTYGPACTNDIVVTVGTVPPGNILPEPESLAFFGLGILGLGFLRRRKAA